MDGWNEGAAGIPYQSDERSGAPAIPEVCAAMKATRVPKTTAAEGAFVRDMRRRSAFDLVDARRARVLAEDEYPEPVRRFLRRERRMVHVRLSAGAKRRLEALSRERGVPVEELARKWVEQAILRDAG
jgi:hypothetical protein